jgi:hypothetical protein
MNNEIHFRVPSCVKKSPRNKILNDMTWMIKKLKKYAPGEVPKSKTN